MRHRGGLSARERSARSRLAQLLHGRIVLCGSLVTMARTCGKERCKCTRGDRHVSLYLSTRVGQERKMIYIPPQMEADVRSWVEAYRELKALIAQLSEARVERLLREKDRAIRRTRR